MHSTTLPLQLLTRKSRTVDAAGLLHALWVNPDGPTDPVDIVTFNYETNNPYQSLFITGDVQAWEDRYSLQATSVVSILVSDERHV